MKNNLLYNKSKIFIMSGLIGLLLVCKPSDICHASEITGEQSIAGFGKMINEYIDETGHSCYTEDIELLANVMYHENHSNGEKVMYYTGAVVLNRVAKGYADGTLKGVLYQKNQYSTISKFFTEALPESVYKLSIKMLKYGCPDVPVNVVYQAMFPQGSGTRKAIPSSYSDADIEYFCFE